MIANRKRLEKEFAIQREKQLTEAMDREAEIARIIRQQQNEIFKIKRKEHQVQYFFYHKSNYFHFQDLLEKRRSAKKLKHTSFCSSIVDALIDMTYELVSLKVCIKAGSFTGSDLQ